MTRRPHFGHGPRQVTRPASERCSIVSPHEQLPLQSTPARAISPIVEYPDRKGKGSQPISALNKRTYRVPGASPSYHEGVTDEKALLRSLQAEAERVLAAEQELRAAREARRRRAVAAIDAGVPMPNVARAAGVTMPRLYQWLAAEQGEVVA